MHSAGFLSAFVALVHGATPSARSPIVIVPGLGGSVLEAKLTNAPKYRDCETHSDWYTLWVSLQQGLIRYDCFNNHIELVLDASGRVTNRTGIEVRPRDFGGVTGIEYSNAGTDEPKLAYMAKMVKALEKVGYVAGVSLRAATNDFRGVGASNVLAYQFPRLRALIEETAALNGGRKVTLISHSLGGPYTNLFLYEASAEWKAQYIESFISLSNPVFGTVVTLEGIISGPMYDWIPQFLPELLVPSIRTFPAMLWMVPFAANGTNVWGDNYTFVRTPTREFNLGNMRSLINALNASVLSSSWDDVVKRTAMSANEPGVPVLCIYANDTKTDLSVSYPNEKFNSKGKRLAHSMGDGTVNLQSLEACSRWKDVTVRPILFGGSLAAHTEIVRSDEVIKLIIEQTKGVSEPSE